MSQSASHITKELQDLGIDMPHTATPHTQQDLQLYFQHFSPQLIEKIKLETYLEALPKTMPFHVPTEYFNNFGAKNFSHLTSKPVENKSILKSNYFKITTVAASVALLIVSIIYFISPKNNIPAAYTSTTNSIAPTSTPPSTVAQVAIASVSKKEATEFVATHIDEYEIDDLKHNYSANTNNSNTYHTTEEPTADEIKAYLQEETIEELL